MAVVLLVIFAMILSVEFVLGNLVNGFIALVNCIDWIRRRKLSFMDQILTALAISRIGQLWFVFFITFVSVLSRALLVTNNMSKIIIGIWIIINHFSVWLTTSLCIFYLFKIAIFTSSVFLYLKRRVEKLVVVTLLLSLVLLFLNIAVISTFNDVSKRNLTYSSSSRKSVHLPGIIVFSNMMFTIFPFMVSLTTFFLLIFSLWRHLRKMQLKATGLRDASTKAHLQGLQTVIAFLVLYTIFSLTLLLQVWSHNLLENVLGNMICQVFSMAYPSGHSHLLILGNTKLRRVSLLVLSWLKVQAQSRG
ncbi:taste receptor type 2 member 140-like [Ochotona curzoniae]|uniref:taste receptor type 2 member 140-like n=1 Tax=Ochotona curzoniae TaxID=130825 RepID=UPI001B347D35|nr:taste receptor type 2 member 140-like [Ochotona curzoniae]